MAKFIIALKKSTKQKTDEKEKKQDKK